MDAGLVLAGAAGGLQQAPGEVRLGPPGRAAVGRRGVGCQDWICTREAQELPCGTAR